MQTTMKNKKGEKRIFISQQYQIGLYVAIYEEIGRAPLEQLNLDVAESKFHEDLRTGKVLKKSWRHDVTA